MGNRPKQPKSAPPDHLSTEAQTWWTRLTTEYDLGDEAAHLLLQTSLESFDRMRACQAAILRDGEMVKDRFEQLKTHPLLAAERDSRGQMLASLKQLNLDIEPLRPGPGRPPGT